MASLLERKLIVVTGKGGTGKSTVACALGLLAARRGLRTIVVELGDQQRLPELFAHARRPEYDPDGDLDNDMHEPGSGVEVELETGLWSTSVDPDRALIDWMRTLAGRLSARMLAASSSFHYFATAAPGAKELVSMTRVYELCEGPRTRKGFGPYDLVVLDAPATGHALATLRSPQTFSAIVRMGPLAEQAQRVLALLEDPARSAYVAVAQASEMAVTETLELEQGLRLALDRDLDTVLVNGVLPRRFSKQELARIVEATETDSTVSFHGDDGIGRASNSSGIATGMVPAPATKDARLLSAAAGTARASYERSRVQQSQIARLRRQRFAGGKPPTVVTIPFAFVPELDLAALRAIADLLERRLVR